MLLYFLYGLLVGLGCIAFVVILDHQRFFGLSGLDIITIFLGLIVVNLIVFFTFYLAFSDLFGDVQEDKAAWLVSCIYACEVLVMITLSTALINRACHSRGL